MKNFKYGGVRDSLRSILHSNVTYVANLTCLDNKDRVVGCANGFCQFSRQGSSSIDRRCIPQGQMENPSGIIIGSAGGMGAEDTEGAFTYACNKPLCNGKDVTAQVQKILTDNKLIPPEILIPSELETTTTTIAPTNGSPAISALHQPIKIFQWMLVMTITTFLKI